MIGINAMVAAREFKGLITTAAQEKVDLIVAGAGFSRDMFSVGKEYGVPIVPIVSYAKLAKIAERLGASAIVVEGTEAGGHLGTQRRLKIFCRKSFRLLRSRSLRPAAPSRAVM